MASQVILSVCVVMLLGCAPKHISDDEMRTRFAANRETFERLVSMLQQDKSLRTLIDDTIIIGNARIDRSKVNDEMIRSVGLAPDRYRAYVSILKGLDLQGGLVRDLDANIIELRAERPSVLNGATIKGFIYASGSPQLVVRNLDDFSPTLDMLDKHGGFVAYAYVEPHWYLFKARA